MALRNARRNVFLEYKRVSFTCFSSEKLKCSLKLCFFSYCSPLWICSSSDLCLLDTAPNIGDEKRFESQHDCRLSCGKYGAIWPMPTGDCSLSKGRVHFDPWKVRFNVVAPSAATTQFIRETNRIFLSNIIKECVRNCTLESSKEILVKATVSTSSLSLDWATDESYVLLIRTTGGIRQECISTTF